MIRWLPYVWMAIIAAATAGFGYGAAGFFVFAIGRGSGPWWPAMVQAHGHVQLFGWGGLMVLGVGFFFIPRLRGAPLAFPGVVPWILVLMAAGLGIRVVSQPGIASPFQTVALLGLAISGALELTAAALSVVVLAATAREGPPLAQRRGLIPVLPYLVLSFSSLFLALAANFALTVAAAVEGMALIPARWDETVVMLGLDGFLVPVSVAVAARSLPLFIWLRVPSGGAISALFWPFLSGLALRVVGQLLEAPVAASVGSILEGLTLVALTVVLGIVPLRRREGMKPATDPHYLRSAEFLLVPAFLWLASVGALQVLGGLSAAGVGLSVQPDVERHALGSGFVTLLILGMGQRMLPGFGGRRIASVPLVWATVLLGNGSALLRVAPALALGLGWVPAGATGWTYGGLSVSGVLGLGAVICFGVNLWRTFRKERGSEGWDGSPGPGGGE